MKTKKFIFKEEVIKSVMQISTNIEKNREEIDRIKRYLARSTSEDTFTITNVGNNKFIIAKTPTSMHKDAVVVTLC